MIAGLIKKFRENRPVPEALVLAVLALIGLFFFAFLGLSDEVTEGDTHAADTHILMLLRDADDPQKALGPPWLFEMVRDISSLGGIAILTLVTVCAAIYLLLIHRAGEAFCLVAFVGAGTLLSNILKFGYARPRPDLVPHGSYTFTGSFPSGHSMMSALVYLAVGMMLAKAQRSLAPKIFFLGISVILTVLIGISRVYLGVHWPSDVLAGWLAGGTCAAGFWLAIWLWDHKCGQAISSRE